MFDGWLRIEVGLRTWHIVVLDFWLEAFEMSVWWK